MPHRDAAKPFLFLQIILGATFLLPLVVVHATLSPYAFSRAMILRVLIAVAVPALILVWRRIPESRPLASPLLAVGAAYLLYYSVNPFLGVDPLRSITSDLERSEGVFALWTYAFLFLAWLTALRAGVSWRRSARVAVAAGTVAVLSALLLTYADVAFAGVGSRFGQIAGTLANPAFFAAYVLVLMTLALMLAAVEREGRRALPGASSLLFFGALLWAQNRGALAGILVAAAAALLVHARAIPTLLTVPGRRRSTALILAGSLAVLVLGFSVFGRFHGILSGVDNSLAQRFLAWRGGMAAVAARPVFGWGQENFLAAFFSHHPSELWRFTDEVFDRAHNELVEHAVSGGAVGVALLLVFLLAIATSARVAAGRREQGVRPTVIVAGAGLLAYGVSTLFLFSTQAAMLLAMFVLAVVEHAATEGRQGPAAVGVPGPRTLVLASTLAALFAAVAAVQPFTAAWLADRGNDRFWDDPARSARAYGDAIRVGSAVTREVAKDWTLNLVSEAEQGGGDDAVWSAAARHADAALVAEGRRHPWYPSPYLLLARLREMSARTSPAALPGAVAAQEEALRRDPFNLDARYRLALLRIKAFDGAGAMAELREAVRRAPTSPEAWKFLALGSGLTGDREAAVRAFARSLALSRSGSPGGASLEEEEAVRSALARLPLMRPVPPL